MSGQNIATGEATKTAAEHKIDDEQVRLYLLNLQDRLRLIEATVNTSASALISDEHDKLIGDVAQVLYELASRKLDDEIKKLARLVKAWKRYEPAAEAPPTEPQKPA